MPPNIVVAQYIPWPPGFTLLTLLTELNDRPVNVDRHAVIFAYFEPGFTVPTPITLDGAVKGLYAVQLPDGKVYLPGAGESFGTAEEWLNDCKQKWASWSGQQHFATYKQDVGGGGNKPAMLAVAPSPARAAIQAALAAAREESISTAAAVTAGEVSP